MKRPAFFAIAPVAADFVVADLAAAPVGWPTQAPRGRPGDPDALLWREADRTGRDDAGALRRFAVGLTPDSVRLWSRNQPPAPWAALIGVARGGVPSEAVGRYAGSVDTPISSG